MSRRNLALWITGPGIGLLVGGLLFGWVLVLTLAVGGVLGIALLRRWRVPERGARHTRRWAGFCAALLAGSGVLFQWVLVANPSDNAYLWLWLMGGLLILLAASFALVVAVPGDRLHRRLRQGTMTLTWMVCAPAVLLLLIGAPLYLVSSVGGTPGGHMDENVARNHLLGAGVLAGVLVLVGGVPLHAGPAPLPHKPEKPRDPRSA